ncbi:MAG TPA: chromate transporter, partial [Pseudonocardiaceae bacterium]
MTAETPLARVGLGTIAKQWGRIGCLGFGGPPTHIAMLRQLCVTEREWLSAEEFQD